MRLLDYINSKMHDGPCPDAGSLGECAALSPLSGEAMEPGTIEAVYPGADRPMWVASLYLWRAAADIKAATVARWFKDAGCVVITVQHVLEDDDNDTHDGRTWDGARHWEVTFHEPVGGVGAPL